MAIQTDRLKDARIEQIGGVPTLTVDGRPIGPMTFQWNKGTTVGDNHPELTSEVQLRKMGEAGVELYFICATIADPKDTPAVLKKIDDSAQLLREQVPNALALLWLIIRPYDDFGDKYPGDVMTFEDGSTGPWTNHVFIGAPSEDTKRYTYASLAMRRETCGMLREVIRHVNTGLYADLIIGYFFFAMSYEWCYFSDFDKEKHSSDYSWAMQQAFRLHLIEKYRGDQSLLKKAWNDPDVTFANAQLPEREKKETPDIGFFWDPSKSMQVYDYAECMNDACAETLIDIGRVCKEESDGKAIVGSFWGYLQNQDLLWGGQTRYKKVLNSPYVDFWASPYTYENRGPGQFASMRFTVKSLQKHGKFYFAEADTFIYDTAENQRERHGFPNVDRKQSEEVLKRDFVYPLCEGTQGWWIDWSSGYSQYDDDLFLPLMRRMQRIGRDQFAMPRGSGTEICAMVDQESLLTTPNNIDNPAWTDMHRKNSDEMGRSRLMNNAIDRFRVHELPYIGAPVDFYETDDVLDGEHYKLYIFMNQYQGDEYERQAIAKNLKKNGNVLVFMYGAGMIRPDADQPISAQNAEDLTGMRMRLIDTVQRSRIKVEDGASAYLEGLIDGDEIGDFERIIDCGFSVRGRKQEKNDGVPDELSKITDASFGISQGPYKASPCTIGPVLEVDDADAQVLGKYVHGGQAGFAIKKFDDWTSVYIGSPCVQAYVLRALAKLANAHLYVEDGESIVYANESFVGIHTLTGGVREVKLRQKADVAEAFEQRDVAQNANRFTEDIPAQTTRLYCLRPELLSKEE